MQRRSASRMDARSRFAGLVGTALASPIRHVGAPLDRKSIRSVSSGPSSALLHVPFLFSSAQRYCMHALLFELVASCSCYVSDALPQPPPPPSSCASWLQYTHKSTAQAPCQHASASLHRPLAPCSVRLSSEETVRRGIRRPSPLVLTCGSPLPPTDRPIGLACGCDRSDLY